uniref:Knottin scorpion toxin-like domain-containing protein n=1 Tax=Setaria viridis TaxID=4556 RepID=A0A4U6V402_SETVI|nr:hypothetical protein SEVIR_4G127100v2 [Setaria viridis]
MARAGAVVALVVLAFLVTTTASSNSMCCTEHRPWGFNQMGCSPDQNGACNSWCQKWCGGGECKFRGGYHQCHCYC